MREIFTHIGIVSDAQSAGRRAVTGRIQVLYFLSLSITAMSQIYDYYIVCKSGTTRLVGKVDNLHKTNDTLFFMRKKTIVSYSYGEHAEYEVVDETGTLSPYRFGNYALKGYRTCGRQVDFMLEFDFFHGEELLKHTLHIDGRYGYSLTSDPFFAEEWHLHNPTQDAVSFVADLIKMGHEARIEIDLLKRDLYDKQRSLDRAHHLLKIRSAVCKGATEVILPESLEILLDEQLDECSNLRRVVVPSSVREIVCSAFNGHPSLEEVVLLGDRVKSRIPPLPMAGIYGSSTTNTRAKIMVPAELLDGYKQNMFWKELADRMFPIDEQHGGTSE